jgi:hypothetical protein
LWRGLLTVPPPRPEAGWRMYEGGGEINWFFSSFFSSSPTARNNRTESQGTRHLSRGPKALTPVKAASSVCSLTYSAVSDQDAQAQPEVS